MGAKFSLCGCNNGSKRRDSEGGGSGGGGSGSCGRGGNKAVDLELVNASNDVELFSLDGQTVEAKVVNVYDGDTCKIVIRMGGELVKFNCRMNGYDSPEMRPPKNQANRDDEIKAAKVAKARLIDLVMKDDQLIIAKCCKFDKYGRLLVDIYEGGRVNRNVNQLMIDEGHGYVYDGGTKKKF